VPNLSDPGAGTQIVRQLDVLLTTLERRKEKDATVMLTVFQSGAPPKAVWQMGWLGKGVRWYKSTQDLWRASPLVSALKVDDLHGGFLRLEFLNSEDTSDTWGFRAEVRAHTTETGDDFYRLYDTGTTFLMNATSNTTIDLTLKNS
jgi:hypothetical protein